MAYLFVWYHSQLRTYKTHTFSPPVREMNIDEDFEDMEDEETKHSKCWCPPSYWSWTLPIWSCTRLWSWTDYYHLGCRPYVHSKADAYWSESDDEDKDNDDDESEEEED